MDDHRVGVTIGNWQSDHSKPLQSRSHMTVGIRVNNYVHVWGQLCVSTCRTGRRYREGWGWGCLYMPKSVLIHLNLNMSVRVCLRVCHTMHAFDIPVPPVSVNKGLSRRLWHAWVCCWTGEIAALCRMCVGGQPGESFLTFSTGFLSGWLELSGKH